MRKPIVLLLVFFCLFLAVGFFFLPSRFVYAQDNGQNPPQSSDQIAPPPQEATKNFENTIKAVGEKLWIIVIALFFLASVYLLTRALWLSHSPEEAAATRRNFSYVITGFLVSGGSWIIYTILKKWLFS